MAEIRINKIIRQYNIGLQDLIGYLHKIGVEVDENPNAKISDEYLPSIDKQFGKDLEMKKASESVDIKLTEILEKTGKKTQEEQRLPEGGLPQEAQGRSESCSCSGPGRARSPARNKPGSERKRPQGGRSRRRAGSSERHTGPRASAGSSL